MFYVNDLVTKKVLLSGQSHDGLYVPTIAIIYCSTHIYKKGWLIIRLSLLIILNLYKVKRFIYKQKA